MPELRVWPSCAGGLPGSGRFLVYIYIYFFLFLYFCFFFFGGGGGGGWGGIGFRTPPTRHITSELRRRNPNPFKSPNPTPSTTCLFEYAYES